MPARIPKACRVRACPNTSAAKHGYCLSHEDRVKDHSIQRRGKGRGGRPWRRLREKIKARANGLCEQHKVKGLYVVGGFCDHILNAAQGGDDSESNLQWLCKPCHDAKTAKEAAKGQKMASGD